MSYKITKLSMSIQVVNIGTEVILFTGGEGSLRPTKRSSDASAGRKKNKKNKLPAFKMINKIISAP